MHRASRSVLVLLRLSAATLACVTAHRPGFAAGGTEPGPAIAVLDFTYVDTSGEERDQRSEHEMRLKDFMSELKRDLAAKGKFSLIAPSCKPDPCDLMRTDQSELLDAAGNAGADFLVIGGIHKMSTLVQWARVEAIDTKSGRIALDKLFTFRGDTDEAWRRAEVFISDEIARMPRPE